MNEVRLKLVILGTGFAAFSLIKRIDTATHDVAVVSPRNHFLFTPLLPSTTVGTIEFRSIIEPIRASRKGICYYQAAAMDVDRQSSEVICQSRADGRQFRLPYDRLAIAVGAVSNTYGVAGVEEHAKFLKELSDARSIREGIIQCFENAATPGVDDDERNRLLRFLVVGGGPTGVEFAAELHDFLEDDLRKWYPDLVQKVRITLLEAQDQILGSFDQALSVYARKLFRRQNVEVRTGSVVISVEPERVLLKDGSEIPVGMVVWSTGTGPTPFVEKVDFPKNQASRLLTDRHLRVMNESNIYAIGDGAVVEKQNFPATAQTAQQQGRYLAVALNRQARGKVVKPFRYRHMGMLAYIGDQRALADLPHVKGRGFITWLFWRSAYVTKLVSWKNKAQVVFDWLKTSIFGRDISRF